jgi:hypothetical protein
MYTFGEQLTPAGGTKPLRGAVRRVQTNSIFSDIFSAFGTLICNRITVKRRVLKFPRFRREKKLLFSSPHVTFLSRTNKMSKFEVALCAFFPPTKNVKFFLKQYLNYALNKPCRFFHLFMIIPFNKICSAILFS